MGALRAVPIVLLMLGCRMHGPASAGAGARSAPEPASRSKTNDELCREDGFDFAFEIPEAAAVGVVECGVGPGTPCDPSRPRYCDGRTLLQCRYGKVTAVDCRGFCRSFYGVTTYDDGNCMETDGRADCACCDVGEAGCAAEQGRGARPGR